MRRILLGGFLFAGSGPETTAHEVSQMFVDVRVTGREWTAEVLFDAGYALPEIRESRESPAPSRDWLVSLPPAEHARIRDGAAEILREELVFAWNGGVLPWTLEFPDFARDPPDFPVMRLDLAFTRAVLRGKMGGGAGALTMRVSEGTTLSYVLSIKREGAEPSYLSVGPGGSGVVWKMADIGGRGVGGGSSLLWLGYRHVLPYGWDHVLFILGLFFLRRNGRSLLTQSLLFTLAHSVTLALVLAGTFVAPAKAVEIVIALSIAVVALENVWRDRIGSRRLGLVFGFGLVHGLGFASILREKLEGTGWQGIVLANAGIELAQITVLGVAWLLTMGWHRRPIYGRVRLWASLAIAATGLWWAAQRTGLLS